MKFDFILRPDDWLLSFSWVRFGPDLSCPDGVEWIGFVGRHGSDQWFWKCCFRPVGTQIWHTQTHVEDDVLLAVQAVNRECDRLGKTLVRRNGDAFCVHGDSARLREIYEAGVAQFPPWLSVQIIERKEVPTG